MIEINNLNFNYKGSDRGGVSSLNLSIKQGETVLLCGSSGSGKTTILRLINGLIPHFYNGDLSGSVLVDGKDIQKTELYDLAGVIGTVFQNPRSQFFSVDTDGEIVFGPENIGLDPCEIHRRKDIIIKEMNLGPLLSRSLFELSGGEKQKIACASVAALFPEIMLLDEPSSNLDWKAIAELRSVIKRWKDQGKTILISEHRLWYVRDLVDRVLYIKEGQIDREWDGESFRGLDAEALRKLELRPVSVDQNFLGQLQRDKENTSFDRIDFTDYYFVYEKKQHFFRRKSGTGRSGEQLTLSVPKLSLPRGRVVGLIGSNGAGKSTLLRCLCGLEKNCDGSIEIDGHRYTGKKALKLCYLVMQDVNHQLFTDSVEAEVLLSMQVPDPVRAGEILSSMDLGNYKETHPMALSGGQKQRVAISSAVAAGAEIMLFDEPTSGLDYTHMCSAADMLHKLAEEGRTVLVSTHDPELLTLCADEIVHIENGLVTEQYLLNRDTIGKLKAFFMEQAN